MKVDQYDTILLKDGRDGCAVEVLQDGYFIVDIGHDENTWDTIFVHIDEIEKVILKNTTPSTK